MQKISSYLENSLQHNFAESENPVNVDSQFIPANFMQMLFVTVQSFIRKNSIASVGQ